MAISLAPIGQIDDPTELIKVIKAILADLEDQLNSRAQVYVSTSPSVPAGLKANDVFISILQGVIGIYVKGPRTLTQLTAEMLGGLSKQGTQYLGFKTSTSGPVLADFPNDNDWGFFHNTTTPLVTHVLNVNGVLKKTTMA